MTTEEIISLSALELGKASTQGIVVSSFVILVLNVVITNIML